MDIIQSDKMKRIHSENIILELIKEDFNTKYFRDINGNEYKFQDQTMYKRVGGIYVIM